MSIDQIQDVPKTSRKYWPQWHLDSVNCRIFVAMLKVGGLSILARGLVVGQDLILAPMFGLCDALDAYYVAAMLPIFIVNLIASSFNFALIPRYIVMRESDGVGAAIRLFSAVSFWSLVLLLLVTLLFGMAFPIALPALLPKFSPEKRALTSTLFFILLPMIPLRGLMTMWSAVLNTENHFALPSLTPAITPLVAVIGLLILAAEEWRIFMLAFCTLVGASLELAVLGMALRRLNISPMPRLCKPDPATRQVIRQFAPMVIGALLMSSTAFVNQLMAAMLDPGSVAALDYGCKLVTWVVGFGALTVGTVVMPPFATMVARGEWASVRHTLRVYLIVILLATVPVTALLICMSEPIVELLFQRGAFTADHTRVVAGVQFWFALQIPVYVAGILVVRVISCMQGNNILMWGAAFNLLVSVIGNCLLVRWMGIGGIALSSTCVMIFSFAFCYAMLRFRLKNL